MARRMVKRGLTKLETGKNIRGVAKPPAFPFILEELISIRPIVKRMFGFTYVYLDEQLLFMLADRDKQQATNGMWLFTTADQLESLGKEFPGLPKRQLWRSGEKAWVVLASRFEEFEEYAFKACELILRGDQRIGRITRGTASFEEPPRHRKHDLNRLCESPYERSK